MKKASDSFFRIARQAHASGSDAITLQRAQLITRRMRAEIVNRQGRRSRQFIAQPRRAICDGQMRTVMLETPAGAITNAQFNINDVELAGARRRRHKPLLRLRVADDHRARGEHGQHEARRVITRGLLAQRFIASRFISPQCNDLRLRHLSKLHCDIFLTGLSRRGTY
ncbi:MAG: hypothetical protein V7641_5007 [Blastocatellia bacterium]